MKKVRRKSGLSQRELTYLLGQKHKSKVSRHERNERVPSLRTLLAYEAIFRVTILELFLGVFEEMAPGILDRARSLSRELDAKRWTRTIARKVEFLNAVVEFLRPRA